MALNGNGKILARIARCFQEKKMQHHQKVVWGYKVLLVERGCGRRAIRERGLELAVLRVVVKGSSP